MSNSVHRSLEQLLQPKYAHRFSAERRKEIRTLVQEAVDLLGSAEVAIDEKHAPSLYSRFLAGLLATMTADPPGSGNGIGVSAKASKRPNLKARVKIKEDPALAAFQAHEAGSSPTSSSNLGTSLTLGIFGSQSTGSTQAYSGSATSPTSTRHSESPSPPLNSPSQGLLNIGQQHPYRNAPSSLTVSTSPLVEGNGEPSISTAELYHTPMLIDQDLLQSMQFMANPVWQDTTVPGERLPTISPACFMAGERHGLLTSFCYPSALPSTLGYPMPSCTKQGSTG